MIMKEIQLNRGMVALVDDEDFERVNQFKWYAKKSKRTYYAVHTIHKHGKIKMHRFILNVNNADIQVDHVDRNGVNNQKENMRLCTNRQNTYNKSPKPNCSSKFKGVSILKNKKSYRARINKGEKLIHLGCFEVEEDAARMYDKIAKELFGEFAYLNFP